MKIIVLLMFVILAGAVMASCRGQAGSQGGWKYIAEIKDERGKPVTVYMDLENIEIDGNTRKFWIRYMGQMPDGTGKEYIRQVGYWEINCFDRSLYRLGEEYYSPDGKLLGRTEKRVREEYSSYDSLGSKMSDVACRYAGK